MRTALCSLMFAVTAFAQDAGVKSLKAEIQPPQVAIVSIEQPQTVDERLAAEPSIEQLERAIVPTEPLGDQAELLDESSETSAATETNGTDSDDESVAEPEMAVEANPDGGAPWRYSLDVSEDALPKLFADDLKSLGSISVGMNEAGRLVNGVHLQASEVLNVVTPEYAYCTQEAAEFVSVAAQTVHDLFPQSDALRVGHVGAREGGYLRPHKSHQAGRDVDLGFYYPPGMDIKHIAQKRELAMDIPTNWALIKAFITKSDVSVILVDKRVQARLKEYALKIGEDKEWLEKLFNNGNRSLIKHARRHRDHFHVRFYAARSQELGQRIQPLLAKEPEQNVLIYRVKKGDNLGKIAMKFGSGVKMIQKANHMTNTKLSVGRTLNIPIRGICTHCPVSPPVVVPPRTLPAEKSES
jgi:LysM repeat protein